MSREPVPVTWIPLAAAVEWYEGHRGRERPTALLAGGARLELSIECGTTQGPEVAGRRLQRVFIARDPRGRRLRITAAEDGRCTVEAELRE